MSLTCDAAKFGAEVELLAQPFVKVDKRHEGEELYFSDIFDVVLDVVENLKKSGVITQGDVEAAEELIKQECSKICTKKDRLTIQHGHRCLKHNNSLDLQLS